MIDRETKEPATRAVFQVSEAMKDNGIITYPNGRFSNILKIKPPMTFDKDHVDVFVATLDEVLSRTTVNWST